VRLTVAIEKKFAASLLIELLIKCHLNSFNFKLDLRLSRTFQIRR